MNKQELNESRWVVKIGKGYFSGYDELAVTYVLDDIPGALDGRIVYDNLHEAETDADNVGGTVEPLTAPEQETKTDPPKTRQVLVKFFDNEEYKTELTEDSARELIEFLEAKKND